MTVYRRLCAWCKRPMGWLPQPQRFQLLARLALWVLWWVGDIETTHGACAACAAKLDEEAAALGLPKYYSDDGHLSSPGK